MIDKPKVANIQDSIQKAVEYLLTQQRRDGSFISLSSENPKFFDNALQFHSTFSTSLILLSINQIEKNNNVLTLQKKATAFLLSQRSKSNSFNYWARNSEEARKMPYPDDLDDTCCAWAALLMFDKKLVDGAVLAKIVALLNATEVKEGGPYRTWIVSDTADKIWLDVDVAVNSNVAYFLYLLDIKLPNVLDFIENCIKEDKLVSPYYPTIFPIIYFVSRFYTGKYIQKLTNILFSEMKKPLNSLDTALIVCSLLNFKVPVSKVEKLIGFLLNEQKKGFLPHPFYTGVNPKRDKTYSAGASSLTSAFVIEAMGMYLKAISLKNKNDLKIDPESQHIQKKIIATVEKYFAGLSKELHDSSQKMLIKIEKMDKKNHITLLPFLFKKALGKNGGRVPRKLLIALGAANLYGWIAYTIYDDFLDNEGEAEMLPVANIALRELTRIFYEISSTNKAFEKLFNSIMNKIEIANEWEISNCRMKIVDGEINLKSLKFPKFGDYEILAHKSLGHALGPLAILFSLGFTEKSREAKHLLAFFTHYLISRQLNDDVHDWEKDLKAGQISPVVAMLLKRLTLKNKKNADVILSFTSMTKFQEVFWYEVIITACDLIDEHVKKARISLKALAHLSDGGVFEKLLTPLDLGTRQAREERDSTIEFITTYKNTTRA